MSVPRFVASCFIAYHLLALTVNAIPTTQDLNPLSAATARQDDKIAGVVTPVLDDSVRWLAGVHNAVARVVGPFRRLSRPYLIIGMWQRWNMFSNPQTDFGYIRLTYYVRSPGLARLHAVRELVLPVGRDDRVRLTYSPINKAILSSLESYALDRFAKRGEPTVSNDLLPMVRFFSRRYAREHLTGADEIIRTELWSGTATVPKPREEPDSAKDRARVAVLESYYEGPVAALVPAGALPKPTDVERDANIVWRLEFVEEQ